MAVTDTQPRRRRQKQAKRRDPLPAGSPEAIKVVRGYVEQQRRITLTSALTFQPTYVRRRYL